MHIEDIGFYWPSTNLERKGGATAPLAPPPPPPPPWEGMHLLPVHPLDLL